MIFLKRRALMTRFNFNYKTASGVGSLVLEKCTETFFKQFKLLGNSVQQETPSPDFPQEIKNAGKWNEEKQKYEVDVQVTGKNLFNISDLRIGIVREDGTIDSSQTHNRTIILNIEKNGEYLIRFNKNADYDALYFTTVYNNGNLTKPYVRVREEKSTPIHLKTGVNILSFKAIKNDTDAIFTGDSNIMISYVKDIEYEPYREPQTVTLSLNQQLRGIGKCKDEVTKDGIVRKIKQITLNGSEDWTLHNNTSKEKTQSFGLVIPVKCYAANVGLKSNRFLERYTVWMGDIEGIDIYSGRTLYINIEKTKASNVEEFKKWLSENQVTVEVVLVEPIIEPLAEENKKALESLHTNESTTMIAVDGGEAETGIEVEYAVKE